MAQLGSRDNRELLPQRARPIATLAMALSGVLMVCLAGCDQPKHAVVRQPVPNPTPTPVAQQTPVETSRVEPTAQVPIASREPALSPDERLARQVEAIFATGEKEYKDGHLSAARQQFDRSL